MADHEFTGDDLAELATKLDQLSDRFTERERALLLATFQMAGDQLRQLGGGSGGLERTGFGAADALPTLRIANVEQLPRLSEGFAGSFSRGDIGALDGRRSVEWDASVSVMGGMGMDAVARRET